MTEVAPLRHATARDWAEFLRPVAASVRNTPTADEFKARVAAVAASVAVPAAWLEQPWRRTEAMRRFQFWPAVFDVAEMFEEDLKAEQRSRDLQARHAALPPPEEPPPLTEEQRAAMAEKARALAAELRGNGTSEAPRVTGKALPLSHGALLAHYERLAAEGNGAAALRAEALRRAIEAAPA